MTNILIGVGGTGAKVVEAAMMMVAAGLGPRELHVGLVDQDNSNGNVARTKQLINDYRQVRHAWSGPVPAAVIDWRGDGEAAEPLEFCRTEVFDLFEDGPVWCPGEDQTTLRNMIGQNFLSEPQKDLFDLLFMPGEEEQDLQLGEGYRGRAHVGAAALIARLTDRHNPLSARMTDLMAGSGGTERVNIFIVGSAFGGTGAAGFPTIARELHRIRSAKEFTNKNQVRIGGTLMLPYFDFAQPKEDQRSKVVTADELLPKAQLALEHYDNLFDTEKTFDRFYIVGWDRFFHLRYHSAGNAEQRNPPLLPELFGAAAAIDFMVPRKDQPRGEGVPILISARAGEHVRWSDLPIEGAEAKIGQLLRFALYWRYHVAQLVEQKKPLLGKGNWTHQLRQKVRKEEAVTALQLLNQLIDRILLYAASMEASAPEDWDVGPWRLGKLTDPSHHPEPSDPVRLLHGHPEATAIFGAAIRGNDAQPYARDAAAVFQELETEPERLAAGSHRGFGRVVAAAYRASRLR